MTNQIKNKEEAKALLKYVMEKQIELSELQKSLENYIKISEFQETLSPENFLEALKMLG